MRQNMQLAVTDHERNLGFADMDSGEQILGGQPHASMMQRIHLLLRGRYKWAIALSMVGAACGSVLGWRMGAKQFMSSGQIHVIPVLPKVIYTDDEKGMLPMFD